MRIPNFPKPATLAITCALTLPAAATAQTFGPAAPAIESTYLAGASSSTIDAHGSAVVTGSNAGSRRAPGGSWSAPVAVATGFNRNIVHTTAAGAATMVSGGPQGIYVQDMDANGRWAAAHLLAQVSAGPLIDFVMNAKGDAMIVYGPSARRRAAGSKAWSKPETVAVPPPGPRSGVQLQSAAIGSAGDAIVTYETFVTVCGTRSCRDTNFTLYAARERFAGTGFKPSAMITVSTIPTGQYPIGIHFSRVTADPHGVVTIAYADNDVSSGPYLVRAVSQTRAQTLWSAPATLYSHPYQQPMPLSVSGDANFQASVLLYDPQISGIDVVDGDTRSNVWSAPATLVNGMPGSGAVPANAIGASGLGGLVLGWTVGDGTIAAVARAATGTAWTPTQTLAPDRRSCAVQCVAVNSAAINDAGQAIITWSFFDSNNELFQFNAATTN